MMAQPDQAVAGVTTGTGVRRAWTTGPSPPPMTGGPVPRRRWWPWALGGGGCGCALAILFLFVLPLVGVVAAFTLLILGVSGSQELRATPSC